MIKDLSVFFIVIALLILGFYALELMLDKNLVESYPFLFGFLFFIYTKTHVLTIFLSKRLNVLVGQLYLIFTVYKFIFTSFFFLFLKHKTQFYTKSYIAVFIFCYFVLMITEYFLYKSTLEKSDKNHLK
jgi:hypothetical protein